MTTNIRQISEAYQAGIAVGRASMKHEIDELAKITAIMAQAAGAGGAIILKGDPLIGSSPTGNDERKRRAAKVPATSPKAPSIIARGVKKAAGPRMKGVKEAIMNMLGAAEGLTIPAIVSMGGFKETSVRATLMGLKKAGIATTMSDKKTWSLYDSQAPTGNSEGEHASA